MLVKVCSAFIPLSYPPSTEIYSQYFIDNQPCRTTVEVSSLPTPIAIELKCIATID